MFFPEKITKIKPTDKVLEIGPGGTPFPRSDVFLELKYNNPDEAESQRGGAPILITTKPIIYYSGNAFPFQDKEFDYVICSHVLEHVEDIEFFLSEMFRVANKGYIEYPTIYYEYIYNFGVHKNILKYKKNTLFYLNKNFTNLDKFSPVQSFFVQSLIKGYSCLVNELETYMFEGFEWDMPFDSKGTDSINDIVYDDFKMPVYNRKKTSRILLDSLLEKLSFMVKGREK